jgi:hypothetical protein
MMKCSQCGSPIAFTTRLDPEVSPPDFCSVRCEEAAYDEMRADGLAEQAMALDPEHEDVLDGNAYGAAEAEQELAAYRAKMERDEALEREDDGEPSLDAVTRYHRSVSRMLSEMTAGWDPAEAEQFRQGWDEAEEANPLSVYFH